MSIKNLKYQLENKEKWVIILVGTPLVGKSTLIREHFSDTDFVLLSRDETLLEIANTDDYTKAFKTVNQKKVDKKLMGKFVEASKEGKNAIVDMTNLGPKRRKYNLKHFDNYFKVAIVFDFLSDDEYVKRNEKRKEEENKFIPYKIIESMKSSYKTPTKEEGFDKIVFLK